MSEKTAGKRKLNILNFDYSIFFVVLFLLMFGLVMVYSTSSYSASLSSDCGNDPMFYLKKQLLATVVGLAAMIFMTYFDYHWLSNFSTLGYFLGLLLLGLILTPLAREYNGAKRWLKIGVSLQPAEAAKLALIIFFAHLVCMMGERVKTVKGLILLLGLAVPHVFAVLFLTSDLSSAIIMLCIVLAMVFVATPNYKEYVFVALGFIILAVIIVLCVKYNVVGNIVAKIREAQGITETATKTSYRANRIRAWLDPEAYAGTSGFQTIQALYAIGSGSIFGKGLGESMQKLGFLPEAQNDMIFSIICEELGLFGAFAVMLMFMILIWRLIVVINNAEDMFGAMLVIGIMAHISIQVILNIGVVTNLIPNTGISLPFISYGGSSAVFLLTEMGIALNVSRSGKKNSDERERNGRAE